MYVRDCAAASNLLWTVCKSNRNVSHLVVLPNSPSEFAADAISCPHFESKLRCHQNLGPFEIARVLMRSITLRFSVFNSRKIIPNPKRRVLRLISWR
jgi:hypothetical protein